MSDSKTLDERITEVAKEFVEDYIRCRVGQGATNAEIKAEIEGFYNKWCVTS